MAAIGGCGCTGMGDAPKLPLRGGFAVPDPTQNPFQVGQEDTSTTGATFGTIRKILRARQGRVADIEAALKADTVAYGKENPIAAQRLAMEKATIEQLVGIIAQFEPLAQYMTQQDREALIGAFADAAAKGSVSTFRLMSAYLPLAQRAGLLNQPAVDAIQGVLRVIGIRETRLAQIATAISADATRNGSVNTTAMERLEAESVVLSKLSAASATLQSVGKTLTVAQSQQVIAAMQAYSQNGNTDAAIATIGQVVAAAGGTR